MAVLVLFSTFSFKVEKHICAGEIMDYAFIGEVDRCDMPNDVLEYSDISYDDHISKTPCCQDEVKVVKGKNNELKVSSEIELPSLSFEIAFIHTYIELSKEINEKEVLFKDYSPPRVIKDIQVLYNSFLI